MSDPMAHRECIFIVPSGFEPGRCIILLSRIVVGIGNINDKDRRAVN